MRYYNVSKKCRQESKSVLFRSAESGGTRDQIYSEQKLRE